MRKQEINFIGLSYKSIILSICGPCTCSDDKRIVNFYGWWYRHSFCGPHTCLALLAPMIDEINWLIWSRLWIFNPFTQSGKREQSSNKTLEKQTLVDTFHSNSRINLIMVEYWSNRGTLSCHAVIHNYLLIKLGLKNSCEMRKGQQFQEHLYCIIVS